MKKHYFLFFLLSVLLISCEEKESPVSGWDYTTLKPGFEIVPDSLSLTIKPLNTNDTLNHYRGLFQLGNAFFISGTDGKILIKTFQLEQIELFQAKYTDLRDIHVLSDSSILGMGIASPGHIWKIKKGETEWSKVYSNMDSLVFMDGMDFWNDSVGLVYGDPLSGYHFILKTTNGGETWSRISSENIPKNLEIEAGFAASGTGIVCKENGTAYIGLGGDKARVLISKDYGDNWNVVETPLLHGAGAKGIYSIAFKDALNGVAVGGNWENPYCDSSKIYTNNGGQTWYLSKDLQHFRSCVTYVQDDTYISTGTSGTDISYDGGKSWALLDSVGFNAIKINQDRRGVAVGSYGRIAEVELK
jgi:photosystem II stability/assembly factor-like uncharacterized protein